MATVICKMNDCAHRSKRPLRKWKFQNGAVCYGCTLDSVVVSKIFDPDGDIEATASIENMAHCAMYKG